MQEVFDMNGAEWTHHKNAATPLVWQTTLSGADAFGGKIMAVMSVTVLTIKPGRFADYLESTKATDALLEKCGAKNLRLISGLVAGEGSGSIVATWEADDFTAFGKVTDAFFANGGVEVMEGTGSADSPIANWQSSTFVDIPH
jgi:hypothetical protein